MKKLVLFDIDGTLIQTDGVGRRALESAICSVFQCNIKFPPVSFSGRTDLDICYEILQGSGISTSKITSSLAAIFEVYLNKLTQEIKTARHFSALQGVRQLLIALEQAPWACLGLLTGNIEPGARIKLEPLDLSQYFAVGAYGSDSANRLDLPEIAHKRASAYFQEDFVIADLVILGDAVHDILCAKNYGAKSIAVCTGKTPREVLAEHNPDHLFDNFADTQAVLAAIQSSKTN